MLGEFSPGLVGGESERSGRWKWAIFGSWITAALWGWTAAEAQTRPGAAAADRPRRVATTPVRAARGGTDASFNRVVTARPGHAYSSRRATSLVSDPAWDAENDLLRPYSARVRQAEIQASMGSTRPRPRVAIQPPPAASSHNYYPGLRMSRHPNANQLRPHCTPSRSQFMAGGFGRGR